MSVDPQQRMGITRPRDLLAVGLVAVVVGYALVRLNYQRMPPLPRFAGVAAAILGIGEAGAGHGLRSRSRPPERAKGQPRTRTPVHVLPSWTLLAAAQSDGVTAIIGLVGALVMMGGALYLEYCCRAPDQD